MDNFNLFFSATMIILMFVAAPARAATTYYVNANTGNDGNTCLTAATACETINGAMGKASNGDTIIVAAGTYDETITVNIAVSLQGAQAGNHVSGRTPGGPDESTILSSSGGDVVSVHSDNVTIDGFTISSPKGESAIYDNNDHLVVKNNIINDFGTQFGGSSGIKAINLRPLSMNFTSIVIKNNQISQIGGYCDNNSTDGIYVGDSGATYSVNGLVIQGNIFSDIKSPFGDGSQACSESPTGYYKGAYAVEINLGLHSTGTTNGARIIQNSISGLTGAWAHAIGLDADTPNAIVQCNTIRNLSGGNDSVGVRLEDNPGGNTMLISHNDFNSNVFIGVNESGGTTTTPISAIHNWWNDATGPSGGTTDPVTASIANGNGAAVGENVRWDPYSVVPNATTFCEPGKIVQRIPTLTTWGLVLLGILLGSATYWRSKCLTGDAVNGERRRKTG